MTNQHLKDAIKLAEAFYEKLVLENFTDRKDLLRIIAKMEMANGIDKVNTRITYKQSSRDKAYKIAYYLSKYGQYELFPDLNQTEALKKCSEIINVKSSTLKVYMNSFDPFTGSGRKSFKGLDLNDNMKKIFKDYNNKDENTIRIELKNILNL